MGVRLQCCCVCCSVPIRSTSPAFVAFHRTAHDVDGCTYACCGLNPGWGSRRYDRMIPGLIGDPQHPNVPSTGGETKAQGEDPKRAPSSGLDVPRFQVLPDFQHPLLLHFHEFMETHEIDFAAFEFTEDHDGNFWVFDIDICSTFNSAAECVRHRNAQKRLSRKRVATLSPQSVAPPHARRSVLLWRWRLHGTGTVRHCPTRAWTRL